MISVSPHKIIRYQARQALKGNYAAAVCGFIIGLLPLYIIDGASTAVICALSLIFGKGISDAAVMLTVYPIIVVAGVLLSPFFNGYVRMYYRSAFSGRMDMSDIYYYFSGGLYTRALRLNLSYILRMLLPTALFFAPVFIYTAVCNSMDNGFTKSVLYGDFYFILTVLSLILTTLYSLRYFTVFTVFIENETLGNKEIFDLSKYIMKGHGAAASGLIFSYTPWMLLCLLILPALYVVPYMTQGLCIGAKWMTQAAYEGRE